MGDADRELISVVGDHLPQLPVPVQLSAIKAFSRLLGSVGAYASAWARRPIQGVEDGTDAKSIISQRIATAVAEKAANDPAIVDAALSAWLPNEVRKQHNKKRVVDAAVADLQQRTEELPPQTGDVDDDWLNSFERFAEDSSSEKMQMLWGRVLSGEIKSPGSFRKATLRFLYELDKQSADDFEWASNFVAEGQLFPPNDGEKGDFARILRLQAAGLVTGAGGFTQWQIISDKRGFFSITSEQYSLVCHGTPESNFNFNAVPLTPVAQDLLQIVLVKSPLELLHRIGEDSKKIGVTGYGIGRAGRLPDGQRGVSNINTVFGELPL